MLNITESTEDDGSYMWDPIPLDAVDPNNAEDYIGLFDIVVAKEHRNQGIGSLLIKHIFKLGKICGAQKAYLQVILNNPAALRLYQKLGFKEKYRYWYRKKITI